MFLNRNKLVIIIIRDIHSTKYIIIPKGIVIMENNTLIDNTIINKIPLNSLAFTSVEIVE